MTPEERRAYNAAYRVAHREELLVRERAYYAAHREDVAARAAAYRAAHTEERRAYQAAYYAAHRGAHCAARREEIRAYKAAHPEIRTVRPDGEKNPKRVEAGRASVRRRWDRDAAARGLPPGPRVLRLHTLPPDVRRAVLELLGIEP
jgi:hypothetical protein